MEGQLLEGRYRVGKELGRGGASVVYKAKDMEVGNIVAVKVLQPDPVGMKEENREVVLTRFAREYEACARLDHPNIIKVHHFGVLLDGSRYIVMDFLPHLTLDDYIDENGAMSLAQAMDLGKQMARALAYCHTQGVIHRDLKPANILVAKDGKVTILDFGMARDLDAETLTKTGEIFGTPMYMAPEQLRGQRATYLTDIYQVGLILYEAMAGKPPFKAAGLTKLVKMIINGDVPPLSAFAPQATPAWTALVHRCMSPTPDTRCPDALALLRDLETIDRNTPVAPEKMKIRPQPGGRDTAAAKPIVKREKVPTTLPPRQRQKRASLLPLVGLFLAGCLLSTVFFWGRATLFKEKVLYGVKEFKVDTGLGWMEVTWLSEVPYPSIVALLDSGGRCFGGEKGRATKNHRVRITGLTEGKIYRACVIYPSGEQSFAEKITVPSFSFHLKKTKIKGEKLLLYWRCSGTKAAKLIVQEATGARGGHLVERSYLAQKDDENFKVSLPFSGRSMHGALVKAQLSDGSERTINLATIAMGLTERFNSVFKLNPPGQLAADSLERVFRELNKRAAGKGNWHLYNDEITRKIRELNILGHYKKAAAISPLVFSTGLFSIEEREKLYRCLTSVHQLSVWSPNVMGVRSFKVKEPLELADFSLLCEPTFKPGGETIVLRSRKQPRLHLTTHVTRPSQAKNWKANFYIKDLASIRAAEFHLRTGVLGPMTLKLVVNGKTPHLYIYDRDTFEMKKFSQFMDNAPMSHKNDLDIGGVLVEATAVKNVYQRIPPSLLREGNNIVELTAAPICTKSISWFQGAVMEVVVRLGR